MQNKFRLRPISGAIAMVGATIFSQAVLAEYILEEVVVTAQKRAQSIQDIGIAVTAFSGDDMKELGFNTPADMAAQTPGMDIKTTVGTQNPIITIRGVGSNDTNANNNPSAAVHVDEVYLPSSAYLGFQLFDIERVEVLKGPQGTLYGRNSTAGAVNFITRKPTDSFEALIEATVGNFGQLDAEGFVSGPISDSVRGRVAVSSKQSDGHIKTIGTRGYENVGGEDFGTDDNGVPRVVPDIGSYQGDSKTGGLDVLSWRASIEADASDTVMISAGIHGSQDNSENFIYKWKGEFLGYEGDGSSDPFDTASTILPEIDAEALGGYFRIEADFSFATLTAVTGYETLDRTMEEEDGSPLRFFDTVFEDDLNAFSQEIRLSNTTDNGTSWVAGFFYSEEEADVTKTAIATDDFLTWPVTNFEQEGEAWALFGQVEQPLSEVFKLTVGLRYTDEEKTYDGGSIDADPYNTGILGPGPGGLRDFGILVPDRTTSIDTQKWDDTDLSGKVALVYTPNDDWLVYASYSKGYKAGGFDGSTITNPTSNRSDNPDLSPVSGQNPILAPFDSETLYAFELGFKSTLADSTLQLNGSLFNYQYEDMQVEAAVETEIGTTSIRTNAGEAEIQGIELEAWYRPLPGLDLKVGVALLDTEVTKWDGAEDFEGNETPDSPESTFNGLARYGWQLDSGPYMAASVDFSYTDTMFKTVGNEEIGKTDSYSLVNARLSMTGTDDNWHLALWGKNLADEEYVSNVRIFDASAQQLVYGMPRTYGLTLSYNWR